MSEPDPTLLTAIRDRAVVRFANFNRMGREPGLRRLMDGFAAFVVDEIRRANGCPCVAFTGPSAMQAMRVSANTSTHSVGLAIAGAVRKDGAVSLSVVGAGAVNQAMKGIAAAQESVEPDDITLACIPRFDLVAIGEREVTALQLLVTGMCSAEQVGPPSHVHPAEKSDTAV